MAKKVTKTVKKSKPIVKASTSFEEIHLDATPVPIEECPNPDICKLCGQIVHNHFFKDRKCKPHHHHTFTP